MSAIDHFAFGLLTPLLAYAMSSAGSLLGLQCTARARGTSGQSRARWLLLAAVSIGGTGIWVMHFIAMLGFRVEGIEIKYEVGLTLLSMLIAIVVVGVGLFIVGFGGSRRSALIAGGVITGLGVASMHYMGMAAMAMAGHVDYDALLVAASVLIAVVAATVALWFTLRVKGQLITAAAALVMGVAISGMHYTGMAAMEVRGDPDSAVPAGASAFDFLLPLVVGISLLAVIMLVIIGLSPTEDELNFEQEFNRSLQHTSAGAGSASGQSSGQSGQEGRDGYWLRGQGPN
ncbi:MAG: hypothetical protein H0U22_00470 [Geodermatophilaceae bacterium]|nr:hypothetical protein [Geodermatophilaceae bacterium]